MPLIPGTEHAVDVDGARAAADELGYPVLLKASAGGGGRGMRLVESPEQLEDVFQGASAEANAAFGDGSLYVEKALVPARHVEVQVLADGQGGVLTLGERECSIQRRHQKLIEESPSPAVSTGAPRGDRRRRRARLPPARLSERGHVRVPPRPRRRLLLHGAERAPAGRASGDGARDRGSTWSASSSRWPPGSGSSGPAGSSAAGMRSRRASTPRTSPATSRPRPAGSSSSARRSVRACGWTRTSSRGTVVSPYYDSLVGKVDRLGRGPAVGDRARGARTTELEVTGIPTTRELAIGILRGEAFGSGRYSTSFLDEMAPVAA